MQERLDYYSPSNIPMTLTNRIHTYLEKRGTWTPYEHIYHLAQNEGYHTMAIADALDKIRNMPHIGYLTEKGYRWYPMSEEEKAQLTRAKKWFESGEDTDLDL
jgi:hypothetical protein